MKLLKTIIMIIVAFFLKENYLEATTYGSYTTPSRESRPPALADGDTLCGFAVFYQGFELADSSVAVTWDCYYPVGDSISLNGGSLVLQEDFFLNTNASFDLGGIIDGNNYIVSLPNKADTFNLSGDFTFINSKIVLNSPVTFDGSFVFSGDCTIEGQSNLLDLTAATIVIDAGATLRIKDLTMQGVTAGSIYCDDTAGQLILDNVIWIQTGDYTFERGSLTTRGTTEMRGPAIFTYTSSQVSTIASKSHWYFDFGMTFSYAASSGSLINFTDRTSLLQLYETSLYSTVPGLEFTKGTLMLEGTCPLFSTATQPSDGVQLGDGVSAANNIMLKIGPESGFDVRSGYLVYNNV